MSITYIEAIKQAQDECLAEDDSVFIYGQDVGNFGGAFKATQGLKKKYPERVLDAPISEDAMVGVAIGAAVNGMKPILEMQFADFSTVGFNQIVNNAATHYFRTGVPVPMTVRLPSGGTPGSGPFHSQCLESIYSHYPGLVVMTPATIDDAYYMLKAAVEMPDPVIYCEHKFLYRWLKADKIEESDLPINKARIVRSGKHATIVTYSAMVHEAVRAADALKEEGNWDIEVVDLRIVKPIDIDTVLASVSRTGRVLVLGEGFPTGGIVSEVVKQIVSEGFHLLDAAPKTLTSKDTPIPYHPKLWSTHRPTPQSIAQAMRELLHQ